MEVKMIVAPEGKYVTQSQLGEGEYPIFVKKVFLAHTCSEEAWRIAEAAEKEAYEASVELP